MKKRIVNTFIKKSEDEQAEEIKFFNLLIAIFIVWVVSGVILFFLPDRGTIGDMYGSINTLFSGLAFGGIIYTIYQQRAEFRLQREELKLQREEVARTNQALNEQVGATNIQRFENTFFRMIELHNEIIRNTSFKRRVGRNAFMSYYEDITSYIANDISEATKRGDYSSETAYYMHEIYVKRACNRFFENNEHYLGHYLRNLYNLLRMVDNNKSLKNIEEKKEYTRIIRSQISSYEYIIIFYNCFQKNGLKFKYYADKFELFDNMNNSLLFNSLDKKIFDESLGK